MKTEITLTVDVANPVEVSAAIAMLKHLNKMEVPGPAPVEKAKTPRKKVVPITPAADTTTGEAATEEAPTITLEQVRKVLADKIEGHRKAIKAKFVEYEAKNMSTLDPDKYQAFYDFLTALA